MKVLSVQSHVVHGYVGNKSAVFILQLHGVDVDAINTVSLSNHSGYPVIKGHRMDEAEWVELVEGLRGNGFLADYEHVLTGYINNPSILHRLAGLVAEMNSLRAEKGQPPVQLLCDPVLGDDGRLYCKQEVVRAYDELLHVAHIATPNYFEASVLSGVQVTDAASACLAADWFHDQGTPVVVIKSFRIPDDLNHLQFLVSIKEGKDAPKRHTGLVPFHEGRYTGTGDAFAASLLAFLGDHPILEAVGLAMGVLQELIVETKQQLSDNASLSSRELRVTKVPHSILRAPSVQIAVTPLTL